MSGGFIFGDFFPAYDGVLSTGMAARMLAKSGMTLAQVVAELPDFHKVEITVLCPAHRKGAVMRTVTERAAEFHPELAEGVRVLYSDGWALVLPHSSEPSVSIWAEAGTDASATARAEQWQRVVEYGIAED
jgi:phosphomannomutase